MSFVVLASLLAVAAASFDYPGKPTTDAIKDFFKENQRIYLYQRSYSLQVSKEDITCIHTMKTGPNLGADSFKLVQAYKLPQNNQPATYEFTVTLSKGETEDDAPVMTAVRGPGLKVWSPTKREYRFHYYDMESRCAVLTFGDAQQNKKCEIQIWENKAGEGPSENCQREYTYLCPSGYNFTVYKDFPKL